ncbi:MAG: 3D domain-containing protein [Eubacteriaceae bacterium]|nr:3D domain-containing protein [Eubacteriaceae bacterium]
MNRKLIYRMSAILSAVYVYLIISLAPMRTAEEVDFSSVSDAAQFSVIANIRNVTSDAMKKADEAKSVKNEAGSSVKSTAPKEPAKDNKPQKPAGDKPDKDDSKGRKMTVTATAYCGCYECNGKWTGYPAADGSPLRSYHTIAADESIPFGTKVYIPYFSSAPNGGHFEVEDRGSAIKGSRIDIYFDSHDEALSFGMRELTIYVG